ncbi:hypothetical protein JCM10213_008490 [Rhodosporidiobolus nylandii]
MSARKRPLPSDWALSNPSRPPVALRRSLLDAAYSSSFSSQTALQAHHSCVNGLAVSPDGRWLASGGDDQRVLLWNASDDGGEGQGVAAEPVGCYKGARSNIFTLSFSCDGSKVFSAGNDASIVCHDIESSSSSLLTPLHEGVPPVDVWLDHDDAVMGLSVTRPSCTSSMAPLFTTRPSSSTLLSRAR